MSLPAAAGYPQYSGVLSPTIWSGKLLVEYYESTALSQIANTEYEGEIKDHGDKVQIRTLPSITTFKYTKGMTLPTSIPEPDLITLNIDQGRGYNILIEDVDKFQSDMDYMADWTKHAGERVVRDTEREDVFSVVYADADTYNQGNSAGKISGSIRLGALGGTNGANHVGLTNGASGTANKRNVLDFIVDAGLALDENDVPDDDRWMVLPSFATALVKTSDLKDASLSGDNTSILRNGRIGMIDRFTIYKSNMLTTAVDQSLTIHYALFGHKSSLTWAAQFVKNQVIPTEQTFGSKARGLNVFGFKVIKKQGFGRAIVRKATANDT